MGIQSSVFWLFSPQVLLTSRIPSIVKSSLHLWGSEPHRAYVNDVVLGCPSRLRLVYRSRTSPVNDGNAEIRKCRRRRRRTQKRPATLKKEEKKKTPTNALMNSAYNRQLSKYSKPAPFTGGLAREIEASRLSKSQDLWKNGKQDINSTSTSTISPPQRLPNAHIDPLLSIVIPGPTSRTLSNGPFPQHCKKPKNQHS